MCATWCQKEGQPLALTCGAVRDGQYGVQRPSQLLSRGLLVATFRRPCGASGSWAQRSVLWGRGLTAEDPRDLAGRRQTPLSGGALFSVPAAWSLASCCHLGSE